MEEAFSTRKNSKDLGIQVNNAIRKYKMIPAEDKVAFALSDGGDSRALLHILTASGYQNQIIPVIIDMGYSTFMAGNPEKAARRMGYEPLIVRVTDPLFQQMLPFEQRITLRKNLETIAHMNLDDDKSVSPCTACYNSKLLTMQYAIDNLASLAMAKTRTVDSTIPIATTKVIFGHHMGDAIESLLKEYFYLKHSETGAIFTRDGFRNFVREYISKKTLRMDGLINLEILELEELVRTGSHSTEEPVCEYLPDGTTIYRPMVGATIFKEEIHEYNNSHGLLKNDMRSGCPHSDKSEHHTGREIIRDEIIRVLSPESKKYFSNLVIASLHPDGTARGSLRNRIPEYYKPTRQNLQKNIGIIIGNK